MTSDQYGGYKVDGFVFNNNRWGGGNGSPSDPGSLKIQTGPCTFKYETSHSNNDFDCCSAPYMGIGTIGGYGDSWTSDQYGQGGSRLPIQLKDIEDIDVHWDFRLPALQEADQFHIYLELFISESTSGARGKGNIAIVLDDHEFYHQTWNGGGFGSPRSIGGRTFDGKLDINPFGQGDFWVLALPVGTFEPEADGVVRVRNFDIKSVIDWTIAQGTYNPNHYLSELSLAFEVMKVPGRSLKTEFASFRVKKSGSAPVVTPGWTASEW